MEDLLSFKAADASSAIPVLSLESSVVIVTSLEPSVATEHPDAVAATASKVVTS
jgi:hypothetical protein